MQKRRLGCLLLQKTSSSRFATAGSNTCIRGHLHPRHPSPAPAASSEHLPGAEIIGVWGFFSPPKNLPFSPASRGSIRSTPAEGWQGCRGHRDGRILPISSFPPTAGVGRGGKEGNRRKKKAKKEKKQLPGLLGGLPPPTTSALHVSGLASKPPGTRAGGGFVGAELSAPGRCRRAGMPRLDAVRARRHDDVPGSGGSLRRRCGESSWKAAEVGGGVFAELGHFHCTSGRRIRPGLILPPRRSKSGSKSPPET